MRQKNEGKATGLIFQAILLNLSAGLLGRGALEHGVARIEPGIHILAAR
jgi:hypothetical protein